MSAFQFIRPWLTELNADLRCKLFELIERDLSTRHLVERIDGFSGFENYLLIDSDDREFHDYIILRLINTAIYEADWRPRFVSTTSHNYDYRNPQNIEANDWFGSNVSQLRSEWISLCKSWNQLLKDNIEPRRI